MVADKHSTNLDPFGLPNLKIDLSRDSNACNLEQGLDLSTSSATTNTITVKNSLLDTKHQESSNSEFLFPIEKVTTHDESKNTSSNNSQQHISFVNPEPLNRSNAGTSSRRPSMAQSIQSLQKSVSSFSLYSHYTSELYDNPGKRSKASSIKSQKIGKPKKGTSKASIEAVTKEVEIVDITGRCRISGCDSLSDGSRNSDCRDGDIEKLSLSNSEICKASTNKTLFLLLKAFIGSGVLFLPKAFDNGGLGLSIALMIIVGVISLYGMLRLVSAQQVTGGSYEDMGGILYGKYIKFTVLFFIVISQLGFFCSYFVFISGNLVNIANVLSNCGFQLEQKYYIWFPVAFIMPLVLIRHMSRISFFVIIADIFILFGLISCIYFTSQELSMNGIGPGVKAVNPVNFGLMIGTAIFSFEGIGLIIPIVETMDQPKKFPLVLTIAVMIVMVIYILIGSIGYAAYGEHIQAAVIYNFPKSSPLTISVQLLYSVAIVLSSPFVLYPAINILETYLFKRFPSGRKSPKTKWLKNAFRLFVLFFCATLAYGIGGDNLDVFVSLIGSLACIPLAFIFPALFHYKTTKSKKEKACDVALGAFGVAVLIYTMRISIGSLVSPSKSGATLSSYCPA